MAKSAIMKTLNGRKVYDEDARKELEKIKNAAPGLVFDTVADMETYVAEHAGTLKVGQDLFIRAADVPDYWWDGTQAVPVETDLTEVRNELAQLSSAIAEKVGTAELKTAVETALTEAKVSGEFKGEKGDPGQPGAPGADYVLTEYDKTEIAQEAAALVDTALLSIIGSGVTA